LKLKGELKKRTAKVQIDTKTREIKEYETQEAETESFFPSQGETRS